MNSSKAIMHTMSCPVGWRIAAALSASLFAASLIAQTNFSPHRVASVATRGQALAAQAIGNYAYVLWSESQGNGRSSGLQVIDVSNPAAPISVGGFTNNLEAFGLDINSHYAYLAQGSSLGVNQGRVTVLDISQPTNLVLVGTLKTSGSPQDIVVDGDFAYVVGTGLMIADISDPSKPLAVGSLNTGPSALGVERSSPYVYMADGDAGLN